VVVVDGPISIIANLSSAPIVFAVEAGRQLLGAFSTVSKADGAITIAPDAVALVG
jgi:hypothetical protein